MSPDAIRKRMKIKSPAMGRRKPCRDKWIKPILCLLTGYKYKVDKRRVRSMMQASNVQAKLADVANFQINLLKVKLSTQCTAAYSLARSGR